MLQRFTRAMVAVSVLLGIILSSPAERPAAAETVDPQYRDLVPHRLLPLLHAPEVHAELGLDRVQVKRLEALFAEIDGAWFQSRIQSPQEQYPILDTLEQRARQWLKEQATREQRMRMLQLEMQAQSVRMLLRNDLAGYLKLSVEQQRQFIAAARATEEARRALQKALVKNEANDALRQAAADAALAEQEMMKSVLTPDQHEQMWKVLGKPFDTARLQRVYPMAPEFVEVDQWINSPPLTLKELRGKVVVVHFYAFQCHNCHANFEIYRRWHEKLAEQGVIVVGIQTPETDRERDPVAVRAAAAERELEFPILVDLASENWQAWGNTMWPTVYVVDKHGYLRQWWQGELNWEGATGDKVIEQAIQQALREPDEAPATDPR